VSQAHAEETANRLEATLEIFNEYFHFELSELPSRMKVRIFAEKADFDSYLRRIIDETREDFIYLHYGDLARNELIGYRRDGPEYDYSLNHQAFIQYLRSFIDNPPLWIREGFAVYFEDVQYDPETGQATYRENLAWLNTLKQIVEGSYGSPPIPLNRMLDIDVETARERIDVFYPQAWGMVSFLLNTENRDINRIMWDAINALDPGLGMTENARAVEREAVRWVEEDALVSSFTDYLTARRSFRDLVEDGMQRYEDGEIEVAEEAFVKALTLRDDSYVPYYYLGLINYDRANFGMADYYYREALDRGATEALTYYALGVNAYADNRFDEARTYLEQTIELDPDGYAEQAEQLIARMED
jgi:tetratricopeptide (TPR) repeat protein